MDLQDNSIFSGQMYRIAAMRTCFSVYFNFLLHSGHLITSPRYKEQRMTITNPTINPINAHLPIALALFGAMERLTQYKISPTSGIKNARIFNPVEGISCGLYVE